MVKCAWGVDMVFLGAAQPNLRCYDAFFLKLTLMGTVGNADRIFYKKIERWTPESTTLFLGRLVRISLSLLL